MDRLTRTLDRYYEPTRKEIRDKCIELGYKGTYNVNFVKDICNYRADPKSLIEVSDYQPESRLGYRMVDGKKVVEKDKKGRPVQYSDREHEQDIDKQKTVFFNGNSFIRNLDFSGIKGSPLTQAIQIASILSKQKGGSGNKKGGGEQESIPNFSDMSANGKSLAKDTNEAVEMIGHLAANDSYSLKLLAEDLSGEEVPYPAIKVAEMPSNVFDLLEKLSLLTAMNGRIGASKRRSFIRDDTARKMKLMAMEDYSQVFDVSIVDRVLPGFARKLATKELLPYTKYDTQETKQQLIYIIDDSSSMSTYEKKSWIKALMLNRLDAIEKGDGVLYVNTFEGDLDRDWRKISNKEEVEAYWKDMENHIRLGRSATNIQRAVTNAIAQVKSGTLIIKDGFIDLEGERPQICVINDGDDEVDPNFSPEIVTHGFILGRNNEGMKAMCQNSGGIYKQMFKNE